MCPIQNSGSRTIRLPSVVERGPIVPRLERDLRGQRRHHGRERIELPSTAHLQQRLAVASHLGQCVSEPEMTVRGLRVECQRTPEARVGAWPIPLAAPLHICEGELRLGGVRAGSYRPCRRLASSREHLGRGRVAVDETGREHPRDC